MKKRELIYIILIILVPLILVGTFFLGYNLPPIKYTFYSIKDLKNPVVFYFYDEKTNCPMSGYLFVGKKLIGKAEGGYFNLSYDYYQSIKNLDGDFSLFGQLGDCFKNELLFDKYWKSFDISDSHFESNSLFNFKTTINPNNPDKRELLGFIQPSEVELELSRINIVGDTLEDLSRINSYLNKKIKYVQDWDYNKEDNYWQTPPQTLSLEQGDCEDYSVALLSLFLAYNKSLNCYNIVFSSHVTTFCKINNYYAYYDQQKTELKREITYRTPEEKKIALEKLKIQYFENYGINDTQTNVHYAFNNKQFIEFKNNNNLIEWQASLLQENEEGILDSLEKEYKLLENQGKADNIEEIQINSKESELPSTKMQPNLYSQKPTIFDFINDYFFLLLAALIVIITLIGVLIRINMK